jgi:deoxyribodipyrimidine photo-lyase
LTRSHSPAPAIVWFRDDQRLADNPALATAAQSRRPLVCLYVHDEESDGIRALGGAARWWLSGSLAALQQDLARRGGTLTILRGPAGETIEALAKEVGAGAVYWNRRYDQPGQTIDSRIKAALRQKDIFVESFNGHLLREPWSVTSRAGTPFRVFTAYWRAASALGAPAAPLAIPKALRFHALPESLSARTVVLDDLALEPRTPDWAGSLRAAWQRSEAAAQARLGAFLETGLAGYASRRDSPAEPATSRLSPYLRFGNISARQVWHAVNAALATNATPARQADADKFLTELGWRDFCYHLLHDFPDLGRRNVRAEFDALPWRVDHASLRAWQRGSTGYPIVDAGMRELWATGTMHNRVRMIAASFLVKDLLIDWRDGEAWFWDTLVDADPANNPANWQWVAGSGADAAPYFRIFNPILQGEKFDPDGVYVKRWVPELARLPPALLHRPWAASLDQAAAAGLRLGETYPRPIVDHAAARQRALRAKRVLGAHSLS